MSTCTPRRSWQSSITAPTCSRGQRIVARMYGSRISSIVARSGMSAGECTRISLPSVSVISYSTLGVVASSSRSYSRSSRSRTMSMWSSPRKPQRKPNPSAWLVSGSHERAASFSASFSSASRSSGNWSVSTGKSPQKTIGLTSR